MHNIVTELSFDRISFLEILDEFRFASPVEAVFLFVVSLSHNTLKFSFFGIQYVKVYIGILTVGIVYPFSFRNS